MSMDMTGWSDLVDLDRLTDWLDGQGLESGPITDVSPLTGGTQNVILRFHRGKRTFVLRRPPRHSIANGSRTMRREARLLAALAGTDVPHPRLIAACGDEDVLGAAFYLMEPVIGFNASDRLTSSHADDPARLRAMGFAMVDGALALGRVDPAAVGLEDFGKVENFLTRQASRWRAQYEGYGQFDGWRSDSLHGVAEIGDWLDAHCPSSFTPGIIHGDYHMANVMFRPDSPALAAIIDWELASLGDPLLDLGWLIATWHDPQDGAAIIDVTARPGFPSTGELIDHYAAGSSRDVTSLLWYKVLACYKLAIILEGSHARAGAGLADAAIGQNLHDQARLLLRRAHRALEKGSAR